MAARRWVRTGALAGIVTIFLALVGLIGGFTDVFLIGDEITFAGLMLLLPAFAAGLVAAAPRIEGGERREMPLGEAAVAAAVAAASAGVVFALAVRPGGPDRGRAHPSDLPQRVAEPDGVRRLRAVDGASAP